MRIIDGVRYISLGYDITLVIFDLRSSSTSYFLHRTVCWLVVHFLLGFVPTAWDLNTPGATPGEIILTHRASGAKVAEKYRLSIDGTTSKSAPTLEQLTHFDFGTGRNIRAFTPIEGDDWRGVKRVGGAIVLMDLDGSEKAQFWYVTTPYHRL